MSDADSPAPTRTGITSGRDPASGMSWAFEPPAAHCAAHDERQAEYWRSRSHEERLAQAAAYRRRRHGDVREPSTWSWRFLPSGEQ
jgi:hypothetical protein